MRSCNAIALLLVAVLYLVQQGTALNCYQCNSFLKQECWDLPETTKELFLQPCKENATGCQKQIQEMLYDGDTHERVHRACIYVDAPSKCLPRTGTYKVKINYCYCKEDGCNDGNWLQTSLFSVLVASGLVYLITRKL